MMTVTDAAKQMCLAIQESPEYRDFAARKEEIGDDAAIMGLIREYKRLQAAVQMRMLAGQMQADEDAQRFQQLSSLLFTDQRTAGYLMAEMRLQKMMSDVFESLMAASGMEIPLPGQ